MNEMEQSIQPKSDQLTADSLLGGAMTIKVESVTADMTKDQPVTIKFVGGEKTYKPNKSMRKVIVHAWGKIKENYIGRSMRIYRDPLVKWSGKEVGGIKISHMTDIAAPFELTLTETRGKWFNHKVDILTDLPAPQRTAAMVVAAELNDQGAWIVTLKGEKKESAMIAETAEIGERAANLIGLAVWVSVKKRGNEFMITYLDVKEDEK